LSTVPAAPRRSRRTTRTPRYRELADKLRTGILRGDYLEPTSFPTESVLCELHGLSRFTVREALRELQLEGLIQRRRGSGTFVEPATARGGAVRRPMSNLDEIAAYARDSHFSFAPRGMSVLPRALVMAVGTPATERWFRFHGVRTRAGTSKPIALIDAYVNRSLESAARQVDPAGTTIIRQLEEKAHVKVERVTQAIQAVSAGSRVAAELAVRQGSPCLRIIRCYLDARGRILEISASHHAGGRFVYSMRLECR
jgi:DNA-binding GntR family transcriptional regulator